MRINFVLPPNGDHPIGGFKIVFQYANQLVKNGNDVSISFLNSLYPERRSNFREYISKYKNQLFGNNDNKITWFKLDDRIHLYFNVILKKEIPKADVVVATAVQTANYVDKLDVMFGRKFYFIQNYETWAYPKEFVNNTFALSMTKIVISKWLNDLVSKYSKNKVYVVPNFINEDIFYLSQKIDDRKNIISMMYHTLPEKNVSFGFEVLKQVKYRIPDLEVRLFGVFDKPNHLPDYVKYYKSPSQKTLRDRIYGESKVYLLPSLLEGWGLTGTEAMASGAILVASDIGGVEDYTINGRNSFLVQSNNLDYFVDIIVKLIESEGLRRKLANNAIKDIKKFNIDESTKLLLKIFESRENQ